MKIIQLLSLTTLFVLMMSTLTHSQREKFCFNSSKKGKVKWNIGCEFSSNDIQERPGNFVDCVDRCIDNPKCTHFGSYFDSTGTNKCWLKSVIPGSQTNNFQQVSVSSNKGLAYCGFIPSRAGVQGFPDCGTTRFDDDDDDYDY